MYGCCGLIVMTSQARARRQTTNTHNDDGRHVTMHDETLQRCTMMS